MDMFRSAHVPEFPLFWDGLVPEFRDTVIRVPQFSVLQQAEKFLLEKKILLHNNSNGKSHVKTKTHKLNFSRREIILPFLIYRGREQNACNRITASYRFYRNLFFFSTNKKVMVYYSPG